MIQKFHFALVEIAGKPILRDVLNRLWLRTGPLISGYYPSTHKDMVQHHQTIIAACKNADSASARAAMRAVIEGAREGMTQYIKSLARI